MQLTKDYEVLLENIKKLRNSTIITQKVKNQIESSSSSLSFLNKSNSAKLYNTSSKILLQVYTMLKEHHHKPSLETNKFFYKIKNIKRLIVALDMDFDEEDKCILDSQYLDPALKIIFSETRFKTSFIPLAVRLILDNWGQLRIALIVDNLHSKVNTVMKNKYLKKFVILKYIFLPECMDRLCNDIVDSKINLSANELSSNNITSFLNIGWYFKNTKFYNDLLVIFTLYVKRKGLLINYYKEIEAVLLEIKNKTVAKKIIPIIIENMEYVNYLAFRDKIINLSYDLIGDPNINVYWTEIIDGDYAEIQLLGKAQIILKKWLTNKFLSVFFNNLSGSTDDDRREYWLKYVDYVVDFKVLASRKNYNYLLLLMNSLNSKYVKSKVSTVTNNSKYIFILKFKNKTIIEFSYIGNSALIYNNDDRFCPSLDRKYYDYNDFKMSIDDPMIFRRTGDHISHLKGTGRLFHIQGWEIFMDYWINNFMDIDI